MLSLGELWCSSSALKTVFLTLFHSWVTSQEASLLQDWAKVLAVILKQRSGNAVTNRACLTSYATACYTANNVELLVSLGQSQWLANDQLQCFETEIIVNISVIDGYLTGTLVQSYTGNRALSSACAVKNMDPFGT